MSTEQLEVFTEEGVATGVSKPRVEIHSQGIWHETIAVWIIDPSTNNLLIQRRSANKDSNPNKWDVSCAGHVTFGETTMQAALKELHEELGIDASLSQLDIVMRVKQQVVLNEGKFIDNEWIDVYLLEVNGLDVNSLVLQEEEVSEAKWVPFEELKKKYLERDPEFVLNWPQADYEKFWNVELPNRYKF